MSETLVIRWLSAVASDAAPCQWLLVDTHGARLGAVMQGTLQEAVALSAGRKLILLVPGADVLHFEPLLPPLKGGAKLSQVVPFALEDQLASDVDALHFAVGKRTDRPGTPVTVVSHDAMQRWLIALRSVGVQPDAVYAENTLVPAQGNATQVLIEHGIVSVRYGADPVVTLDVAPLEEALRCLLPANPQSVVTIYMAEDEYDAEQATIEAVRERVGSLQVKLLPEGVLPLLAMQAAQHGALNLLQGPYAPRTSLSNQLQPWRYAAVLLLAFVLMHLLTQGFKLWQLNKQEATLDQQIQQTYARAIPGGTVKASDARRAFESKLIQMKTAGAGSGLMNSLDTLAGAVIQTPDLQVDALAFRNDSVDVRLIAPNIDALEKVRQQAQAHNMTAEIQSANPKNNKIEGRLQLKLPPGA